MPADLAIVLAGTISPRDVAEVLCVKGYVPSTLPRRDEELSVVIAQAYRGTKVRLVELPARPADFREIRQQVDLITREAERHGRSLECKRYRPAFVKPIGRE